MAMLILVSLLELVDHPDRYHGQRIRVVGFATLEFEGKAIYVSKADFERAHTKKALWLDIELTPDVRKKTRHYVEVEGVLTTDNQGHLRMYSGAIEKIDKLELWHGDVPKSRTP
jgi:hypothetical protein